MKNTIIIISSIVLILVLSGFIYYRNNLNNFTQEPNTEINSTQDTNVKNESKINQNAEPDSVNTLQQESGTESLTSFNSGFIDFNPDYIASAKNGRVVLFFHASWCPSCRGLESDLEKNKSQIPKDLLIMKVNYDNSSDLKNKYKIVQQHTLVQVDQDGNLLKSNTGLYQLNTLAEVDKTFSK